MRALRGMKWLDLVARLSLDRRAGQIALLTAALGMTLSLSIALLAR